MRFPSIHAARVAGLSVVLIQACGRSTTVSPTPAPAPVAVRTSYATGEDVLAAMRARYDGRWHSTLTFTQKTSRLQADGKWNVQTWLAAMKIPGKLRIDFAPLSAGNGVVYIRDSVFTVSNGRPLPGQPAINPLLLLGFDVYANAPGRTASLLRKEGFDLTRVYVDTFDLRPMIVVGARSRSEGRRKQFWVDAERLYFVRLLQPSPRDSSKVQDIRSLSHERRGGAWTAPRGEIHNDGKLVLVEEYSDVKTDVPLSDALFDPSKWKTVKHWMTP